MRLAESNENRGFFLEHCPIQAGTQLEGGVFQESLKRYSTPAYFYLSHSAVVIPCESAPPLPTREKGGDESDPPPNRGGSLSSLFIPAGRLGTGPLSPRASSCRIGPRRQGFASPLRALDGCGPIRKTRCLRGERGDADQASDFVSHLIAFDSIAPQTRAFGPCGRAERNLSAILDALSRSRGALSPAGP